MSSQFTFGSPHIPPVPHSTPATASKPYFLNKPRAPRPPVVNPYDRFTQVEFDEWIGSITGALRKALGQESDEMLNRTLAEPESASAFFNASPAEIYARPTHRSLLDDDDEEFESDGEGANDSLANIKARYEARMDKGKARDPMEGPGLSVWGRGEKSAPIEIDLDESEVNRGEEEESSQILLELDEDALDDQEVAQHLSFVQHSDDEGEAEAELDMSSDRWEPPQSSLRSQAVGDDIDQREDENDERLDDNEHASSSSGDEEQQASGNVIEILSSEDEAGSQGFANGDGEGYAEEDGERSNDLSGQEEVTDEPLRGFGYTSQGAMIYTLGEGGPEGARGREQALRAATAEEGVEVEEEYTDDEGESADDEREDDENEREEDEIWGDEDEEQEREEDGSHPTFGDDRKSSPEIIDLDSDAEEDRPSDEPDDIQPPEHDTSFPPHLSDIRTHVEIRNPWLGPRTYAEDYYAGGPVLFTSEQHTLPDPHVLSVDDREDFLTSEVVTPAESNERESSTGGEIHEQLLHVPHLQFVHGTNEGFDVLPEAQFGEVENEVELVAESHDGGAPSVFEADVGSTKDAVANHATLIRPQDDRDITAAKVEPQKGDHPEQLYRVGSKNAFEDQVEEGVDTSRLLQGGIQEEAVYQAEAAFGEEMDVEILRDGQQEDLQCEGRDVPHHTHRKVPSVTVEDVTDEEATDEVSNEEPGSSSPAFPVGAIDLDVELAVGDGPPDVPSSQIDGDAESSHTTIQEFFAEVGDVHTPSDVVELTPSKSPELHTEDLPASAGAEGSTAEQLAPPSPALLPTDVADFEGNAEEIEPEQQQLPTPPAEQEFSHHESVKHHLPESQDTLSAEDGEVPILEGDAVSKQDSLVTLTEQSPTVEVTSLEKEDLVTMAIEIEEVSTSAPNLPPAEDKISEQTGSEENAFDLQIEPAFTDTDVLNPASMSEFTVNVVVEDVTKDFAAVVDDSQAIIEEISSKAASEEPSFSFDEQYVTGELSKEGSVVSLSLAEASEFSRALSYTVEELVDGITDEDADGEVDPDLGGNMAQNDINRTWDDLADEIFDADIWAFGEPLTPPADTGEATHQTSQGPPTTTAQFEQQTEPKVAGLVSRPTLPGEPLDIPEHTVKSAGAAPDEDDIASSRESSPSAERPTRSPSPALCISDSSSGAIVLAPSSSPYGSEKDLYGDERSTDELKPHEAVVTEDGLNPVIEETPSDPVAGDASATIPGLMLTTSLQPLSPIPGLGIRLAEDAALEVVDGEIPGLTWSKTLPPSGNDNGHIVGAMPQRSASSPHSLTHSSSMSTSHAFPLARRATEPVLFSDPYPYSLSTPGLGSAKEEAGDTDEEEEQHMSMSSSSTSLSLEKELERGPTLEANRCDQPGPPAAVSPKEDETNPRSEPGPTQEAETNDGDFSGDADQDRDADGDLDPDFLHLPGIWNGLNEKKVPGAIDEPPKTSDSGVEESEADVVPPLGEPEQTLSTPELINEPPLPLDVATETATADAQVASSPIAPQQVAGTIKGTSDVRNANELPKPSELSATETAQPTVTRPKEIASQTAPIPGSSSSQGETVVAASKQTLQNGKRKRSPSPTTSVRVDDTMPLKPDGGLVLKSVQVQDRSKRPRNVFTMNEKHEDSDSNESSELSVPSDDDSSDASSAYRLLRASSLESGTKSTAATPIVVSPPAVMKAAEHFYPMLHRHGRGGKNQNRTEQAAHSQRSVQKTQLPPSLSRTSDTTNPGSPGFPPSPFTSSRRATRSNCRYRKISVPKEEEGPRVCFLVPGCSLGDEEVIEENEIEDLGEATYADSLRMIQDIGSLDFDSYLIGVLRQLVGVDLLREQEVFYLPAVGEERTVRKTQPKKSLSDKSTPSKRPSQSGNLEASSVMSTPRHSVISAKSPSLSKAPLSNTGSTSASISATRRVHKSDRESITPASSPSNSSDEGEDTERKQPKPRPRPIYKTERAKEQKATGGKEVKRGRRLGSDVLAYKPQSNSDNDSSADERTTRLSRKKSIIRNAGIKRTRSGKSFAIAGDADGRETKKLKRER